MLGLVSWSRERNVVVERTQVLGMPVLEARVPTEGAWEKRRLGRAARLLKRQGVRRVLVPRDFTHWDVLTSRGLTGVDVLPLYRAMADRFVLAELERRGVEAHRACVILRGERVDADLARAARLLCPRVRSVVIQVEWGGDRLVRELYWEFGAVAARQEVGGVAVRFGGEGQAGELVLCGRPELLGLELETAGLTLPEAPEPVPLLAALWQAGRLGVEKLRVGCQINLLDIR